MENQTPILIIWHKSPEIKFSRHKIDLYIGLFQHDVLSFRCDGFVILSYL